MLICSRKPLTFAKLQCMLENSQHLIGVCYSFIAVHDITAKVPDCVEHMIDDTLSHGPGIQMLLPAAWLTLHML